MTLHAGTDIASYRHLWKQTTADVVTPADYPGWPDSGFAVLGDFSGIQSFVFRPVPGAGGAARRLRSRSFRVSAYSELIMRWCLEKLSKGDPITLYSTGGRFLTAVKPFDGFQSVFEQMRAEVDAWAWNHFSGELIFHLAATKFDSGKLPYSALREAMETARSRPLAKALASGSLWSEHNFFQSAASGDGRCDACGLTRHLHTNADAESICDACAKDEALGRKLPRTCWARLSSQSTGDLSALGINMELSEHQSGTHGSEWLAFDANGHSTKRWHILRHLPAKGGIPLDFGEIAELSPGSRKWLGYLRIDGDGAGGQFADLQGDPRRFWALSRLLNSFFVDTANRLLSRDFPNIYPVYGGGDDLFVVGAWNQALDFALRLREELTRLTGHDLTFSAGLSLSKPREHVLTHASLALKELESAKKDPGYQRTTGRDQIRALGVISDWPTFSKLLSQAKQVTRWIEEKKVPGSFLHQLLQLHHSWRECLKEAKGRPTAKSVRYKPLLYYQIQRNLGPGEARDWATGLLQPSSLWPWIDFVARYAMLAARRGTDKE